MSKTYLDIDTWNRKDHFRFFKEFEEPFFGICVDVDVSLLYARCKEQGHSFYLSYMHRCLKACNEVESFKYRIENNSQIAIYDEVHASAVVLRDDDTFGFSYIKYVSDFQDFALAANEEITRVKSYPGLEIDVAPPNVVHISALPWFRFTSMSHARSFSYRGSNPMISFGKITEQGGQKVMPVSIHVHHGLMDGIHVGKFLEVFQEELNK